MVYTYTLTIIIPHSPCIGISTNLASISVGQPVLTRWASQRPQKKRGYMDFYSNGPLLAAIGVDKRRIYFLSVVHVVETQLGSTCTAKKHIATGAQKDKPCPPC